MILKGAPLTALNNPAAFLIIIGGTVACIFNAFTMEQISKVPTLFKLLIQGSEEQSKGELVQTFVELSQLARREGILALESRVEEIQDPFFRNGLSMVIDGMDPEFVGDVLDAELTIMEQRHAEMRSIFSQAGTYAPTLGVLGAVVGLIA
ncbi:MAG: MotA/TolQ/ExbB proton channel family protein, partial [Selenomonadaceae bacterium]|nr:MotA/TolQ/ExbB proton channel family protein [Selenomonadaceae bacterium]